MNETRALYTMDPHVIFEDYGVPLTDLSSITSMASSTATELADLDELAQLMARPASRADAAAVASALAALKPAHVAPVLASIIENVSPDTANLMIDALDEEIIPATAVEPLRSPSLRPCVSPVHPPGGLIETAARAIVEVVDEIADLVTVAIKAKKTPPLQRALIDLAPPIAGLLPQDGLADGGQA